MSTSSTTVAKAYHHGDLREALIAAAMGILEEGGATLSLREAARRAGVSAMAPYRHFADKDALLAAVADAGFRYLATDLRAADQHLDVLEALVAQGVAYVRFATGHPGLFRLMFGASLAGRHGTLAAAGDAAYGIMSARVAAMVPAASASDSALRCWAVVHGLAALAIDGQLADQTGRPDEIADRILRLEWSPLAS